MTDRLNKTTEKQLGALLGTHKPEVLAKLKAIQDHAAQQIQDLYDEVTDLPKITGFEKA